MRLSVIFVATLAVSVILSSTATWGLTYGTSYAELRDMSNGFVELASGAVNEFGVLALRLITDSSMLVSSILTSEYNRSMTQLNETGQQLLQTTLGLINQTQTATAQAQDLVAALVISFGNFMQSVITDFRALGADYASRLRTESALRAQLIYGEMMQDCVFAIQRPSRLYNLGMLNFTWSSEDPIDSGSCTLVGSLCSISSELGMNAYVGLANGATAYCDAAGNAAYILTIQPGPTADRYKFVVYLPYVDSVPGANFTRWKQYCLNGSDIPSFMDTMCPHGSEMKYPDYCNRTCGFDPRCRAWYTNHYTDTSPRTRMTSVYADTITGEPVVTLSYSMFAGSSGSLLGVAATDFYLSNVDAYLQKLSSSVASQLVVVVLNSSNFTVVGTSVVCPNTSTWISGQPIAEACDPVLQKLGDWLALNQRLATNSSMELAGTLWDVFPATVDSFSYFVAVGMNKSQEYAVVTAISQAANETLQNLSHQQSAQMAAVEKAALAEMQIIKEQKVASLEAMEQALEAHMQAENVAMEAAFNASRQQSTADLQVLTSREMTAIVDMEQYHLSQMSKAIGVTFGAVVGILAGILLFGSYGTWAVTKQVRQIAEVIEDVACMKVEELEVTQKSCVREVQRIEAALVVLVRRLAEYKSYMPAGLFQAAASAAPSEEEACHSPTVPLRTPQKRLRHSLASPVSSASPRDTRACSLSLSLSTPKSSHARLISVVGCARLFRRSVAVMAVNVVRFQAEAVHRPSGHLETMLNRLITVVHGTASKSKGNLDTIVGDQVLVTFNAHFACSDPTTAASSVALEVMEALRDDPSCPCQLQIGVAAGLVYAGHVGYTSFKSMVTLGAPMKVASILAHLSGFDEPVVLVCPMMEERVKYSFSLQPADLVALPALGEHIALYARSVSIFVLGAHECQSNESQEWMYEVGAHCSDGQWKAMFSEIIKAPTIDKAKQDLRRYVDEHPEDWLARRLLNRLALWQPRVGIVLAERPDVPQIASLVAGLQLSDCGVIQDIS